MQELSLTFYVKKEGSVQATSAEDFAKFTVKLAALKDDQSSDMKQVHYSNVV